jgi:hypothetical protein
MSKVVITAQVQDPVKWEAGFRTHRDVFRTYTFVGRSNIRSRGTKSR